MRYDYRYEEIDPADLTHTDLRELAEAEGSDEPIHAFRVDVYKNLSGDYERVPNRAEALVIGPRIGIAWGSDASWGDLDFNQPAVVSDALDCYFNRAGDWQARN